MRNWFLVVLLAIPLTACPQTPSTSGPHALKGVVVQEGAGEAVAGSTVKLFLGNTLVATSTTDAQGGFSFSNLPEGTFRLEVQKPGMAGSRVEGVRVPEVQSLRIIQKPAFDASATTTPPTLLITKNGTEPVEEQTFENSIPFRVQVDTTRDYVKPMRYIYVALGRTPGA
ncbi:MAG: carboxypeptidase-like regulatory domain-containing protein, partial [Thermaceae bacterium]